MAMAPPQTQLLLLSGSVANPHQVVEWLKRLGRDVVEVQHHVRPVPWRGHPHAFAAHSPKAFGPTGVACRFSAFRGSWPILLFAPRRRSCWLAMELAMELPPPLMLKDDQ